MIVLQMASSVSVGIVGEGPIGGQRDVVRPFDRQRHSGGGERREEVGFGTTEPRDTFSLSLSCSQLLPVPETRAAAQTDGEEVCALVCLCVRGGDDIQLCTSVRDGEGEI